VSTWPHKHQQPSFLKRFPISYWLPVLGNRVIWLWQFSTEQKPWRFERCVSFNLNASHWPLRSRNSQTEVIQRTLSHAWLNQWHSLTWCMICDCDFSRSLDSRWPFSLFSGINYSAGEDQWMTKEIEKEWDWISQWTVFLFQEACQVNSHQTKQGFMPFRYKHVTRWLVYICTNDATMLMYALLVFTLFKHFILIIVSCWTELKHSLFWLNSMFTCFKSSHSEIHII